MNARTAYAEFGTRPITMLAVLILGILCVREPGGRGSLVYVLGLTAVGQVSRGSPGGRLDRDGWRSLAMVLDSICRIRSRVTP